MTDKERKEHQKQIALMFNDIEAHICDISGMLGELQTKYGINANVEIWAHGDKDIFVMNGIDTIAAALKRSPRTLSVYRCMKEFRRNGVLFRQLAEMNSRDFAQVNKNGKALFDLREGAGE